VLLPKLVPPQAVELAPSVMEFLPLAALMAAEDGRIVSANARAAAIVGAAVEAIVGSYVWDHAPTMRGQWAGLWRELRAARHVDVDVELPGTSRGARLLRLSSVLVRDQGVELALCVGLDLTERNLAEAAERTDEARRVSQRQLESVGQLAGGIAHDFNNHLVGVLAEASAAQEDPTLSPETRAALRRIEAAALRMSEQTRQLLAYAGRGRFITERLDPDVLLDEMSELLRGSVPRPGRLLLEGAAGRALVDADPGLLRQVIHNLVANAGEALRPTGGTVTVSTSFADERWRLTVADDGVGMDPATQARAFDPFFSTKRDGHGLGLSAVEGIVARLGGTSDLVSAAGAGSKFTVALPALAGADVVRGRAPSRPIRSRPLVDLRVLVADDEPSVRATVCRLLERRGATVVTAIDGADAIDRLADGAFGLVVLDVSMPICDGYEVLPVARARQPQAAVLMMSGYTESYANPRGGGARDADGFIPKPFTARELDAAIDRALERVAPAVG
jgi:PAS domain S-box-containing protein